MKNQDCITGDVVKKLQSPFPLMDIEWRVSHSGSSNGKKWAMVLAYVTNRAIQNRLDDVFGPAGWKNSYQDFKDGILCTISCSINGEWVEKTDGSEQTEIESLKGGLSGAMKRAAVQWGIGRYLYKLDSMFVEVFEQKREGAIRIADKKNNVYGYWIPPKLPDWALPMDEKNRHSTSQQRPTPNKSQDYQKLAENHSTNNRKQQPDPKSQQNSNGFNRESVISTIGSFLKNTELDKHPGWIMPLFKRINPGIKQVSLTEVYKDGTENELKMYYNILKPVNDLKILSNYYKVSIDDVLNYTQILCPQIKIDNLFSCFMNVNKNHVKEIVEFVKSDLKNGLLKQIA